MPDKKITDLTAITTIVDTDVLPIVDVDADETKKITISQVKAQSPVQSVNGSTGTVTVQETLVSGTNIKTINSTSLLGSGDITISGGSTDWGDIGGTLSNQTDLQSALDAKVDENAAITGATKTKITYDSKGLVTAGADLAASDLPSAIDATKIADGSVTNTEFQYIGGLTSDAQTQIDGKQATITGAATTIDDADLTASRALVSDGSGKVAVSDVTSTELGYLDGVTSAVQTQVDAKIAKFDGTTYDINALSAVTQAEYDALTPSATTIYFII